MRFVMVDSGLFQL